MLQNGEPFAILRTLNLSIVNNCSTELGENIAAGQICAVGQQESNACFVSVKNNCYSLSNSPTSCRQNWRVSYSPTVQTIHPTAAPHTSVLPFSLQLCRPNGRPNCVCMGGAFFNNTCLMLPRSALNNLMEGKETACSTGCPVWRLLFQTLCWQKNNLLIP
jgi:hypothetical protein